MISQAPLRRAEAVYAGLAASFISFCLGAGLPRLVGLWEDEASHGRISLDWMKQGLFFSGSFQGLLMKDAYQGTLKSMLLWPSFALFGPGTTLLRLTTLAWGAAAAGLLTTWAWRRHGRTSGLFVAALVAFDPYLIFNSVFGGSEVLSLLLKVSAIAALGAWTEGPAALWAALGAGLLCGLAVWDKAHFLWVLAAAPLALAVAPRPARGPRLVRRTAVFALGAAAGAAPILWFNLMHPLATFLSQARLTDWANHDAPKMWPGLRAGLWLAAWNTQEPYRISGAELPSLRHWYAALAALGTAALAARGASERARREGAAWLALTAGGFAVCAVTPAPVKWHHFMVLYPLPVLAGAAWLSGPAAGARRRLRRAAFALAVFAAALGVLDVRRFAADAAVHGGKESFARASVEAARWFEALAARTPGLKIFCPDMLESTFMMESGGGLPIADVGKISISAEAAKDLAEGRLIWIRRAEKYGFYNPLIDSLEKTAGRTELAVFRMPSGAAAFTVYRAGVMDVRGASRAWSEAIASVVGTDSHDSATLWLGKAAALSRAGDARGADREAALELARKVMASSKDPLKIRSAAIILKALGAHGEAASVFESLSRASPDDAELQVELAFCDAQLGRKEEALSAARRVLALTSDRVLVRRITIILKSLGAYGEAASVFERLSRSSPGDAQLQSELAFYSARIGHKEEALSAARRVLALTSDGDLVRRAAGVMQALDAQGEAVVVLERLAAGAPEDAGLQVDLARIYARLGRKEDGLRAARKALTLKSGVENKRRAAILLQDLGSASEASAVLERLLRAAPNDASLETDAAVAQYLSGRREEAVARLRKIVARHPELVAARRNLDAALSK